MFINTMRNLDKKMKHFLTVSINNRVVCCDDDDAHTRLQNCIAQ